MEPNKEVCNTYNRIAEKYHKKRLDPDASQWNDLLESPAMERLLRPLCPGRRALDIGCGTGILTAKMIAWGADTCGIEPAEQMIALAKSLHPTTEFHIACAEEIPFPDQSFDLAASSLVLHYIQLLQPVFREVGRVLRPGGYFVFSMHHPFEEILQRVNGVVGNVPAKPYFHNDPYHWQMCGEQMLSYHHTLGDIVNGLAENGFQVCAVDECRPSPDVRTVFSEYEYTANYPPFCAFKAQRID